MQRLSTTTITCNTSYICSIIVIVNILNYKEKFIETTSSVTTQIAAYNASCSYFLSCITVAIFAVDFVCVDAVNSFVIALHILPFLTLSLCPQR